MKVLWDCHSFALGLSLFALGLTLKLLYKKSFVLSLIDPLFTSHCACGSAATLYTFQEYL